MIKKFLNISLAIVLIFQMLLLQQLQQNFFKQAFTNELSTEPDATIQEVKKDCSLNDYLSFTSLAATPHLILIYQNHGSDCTKNLPYFTSEVLVPPPNYSFV